MAYLRARRYLAFPPSGSDSTRAPVEWTWRLRNNVNTAVTLSMVVGVIVGLTSVAILFRTLQRFARVIDKRERGSDRARLAKQGVRLPPGKSSVEVLGDIEGEEYRSPSGNPFKNPFVLINRTFLEPLHHQYIDSIVAFVRRSFHVIDSSSAAETRRFIYMREFVRY